MKYLRQPLIQNSIQCAPKLRCDKNRLFVTSLTFQIMKAVTNNIMRGMLTHLTCLQKIFVSFDNIMMDVDGYDKINIFKSIKRLEKNTLLYVLQKYQIT